MVKLPKIVSFLAMMIIVVALTGILPYTLLLGKGEFGTHSEFQVKADLFSQIYILGLITVLLVWFIFYLLKKNDKFGDNAGIFNLGEKPGFAYFKRFTNLQLTWLSTIVFSILFLVGNITQFIRGSFIGLNFLPQQFSATDSLIFSSLFTPTAENLLFTGALGFFYLLTTLAIILFINKKNLNVNVSDYQSIAFIIATFVASGLGVIWHQTAYSNSTIALGVVFFFWMIMGLMALATGSWTVPLMFHILNNFFIDFSRLFTSDALVITTSLIILTLSAGYFFVYKNRWFGSHSSESGE